VVLVALRDDRRLLNDPEGLLSGNYDVGKSATADSHASACPSYPDSFSVERFIEVIETGAVWEERVADCQ